MIDRVYTLTRCTKPDNDGGPDYRPRCRQGICRDYPEWTVSEQKAGYYGRQYGTTASTIRYCADHIFGYLAQRSVIGLPETTKVSYRDFSIFQQCGEGIPVREIAEAFKLSTGRINQIRIKVGAALSHGGRIEVTK